MLQCFIRLTVVRRKFNSCQTNNFIYNLEIDLLKIRGKYVLINKSQSQLRQAVGKDVP